MGSLKRLIRAYLGLAIILELLALLERVRMNET